MIGVPNLFLSSDKKTSQKELKLSNNINLYTKKFVTKKVLYVVDFCDLPDLPNIFDIKNVYQRKILEFFRQFSLQISKKVNPHTDPLEFIPTQIISEFIRSQIVNQAGNLVDGIKYRSLKSKTGSNIAFFFPDNKYVMDAFEILDDVN